MNDQREQRWLSEFSELGTEKVRNGLTLGRWDKEKRAAARQWLEQRDVRSFQAKHSGDTSPNTFIMKLKGAKWWAYAAGGILGAMVLARLLPRLFQ